MNFYKKVLILKEQTKGYSVNGKELSGVVRVEHEDATTSLSLSLINFCSIGESYYCSVLFENNEQCFFELGKKPTGHIKIFHCLRSFNEFSVVVFICDNLRKEIIPVAFSTTEGGVSVETLIQMCKAHYFFSTNNEQYDDEAVATEDYYSLEEGINQKIEIINGWKDEHKGNDFAKEYKYCQKEKEKGDDGDNFLQDEEEFIQSPIYTREHPYYLTAKRELDELFDKFPKDHSLSSILPTGTFCKIPYSEDRYYIVGTVKEQNEMKYICYGVPGEYSKNPPEKLKGRCTFVPRSIFDLQGEGFWMMFQDAISGECIKEDKNKR